jgi:hypothetical protein
LRSTGTTDSKHSVFGVWSLYPTWVRYPYGSRTKFPKIPEKTESLVTRRCSYKFEVHLSRKGFKRFHIVTRSSLVKTTRQCDDRQTDRQAKANFSFDKTVQAGYHSLDLIPKTRTHFITPKQFCTRITHPLAHTRTHTQALTHTHSHTRTHAHIFNGTGIRRYLLANLLRLVLQEGLMRNRRRTSRGACRPPSSRG